MPKPNPFLFAFSTGFLFIDTNDIESWNFVWYNMPHGHSFNLFLSESGYK